jgi:hypothetical protein
MLRPFDPEDLDRKNIFDEVSDIIVRPISSSLTEKRTPVPTEKYDKSFLTDLTNLSDELLDSVMGEENAYGVEDIGDMDDENEFTKEFDTSNEKDENLLAMIFKIIPIGINIAKRGKTVATGFKELSTGIVDLLKNAALLTATTGIDTILFFIEFFIYAFKVLLCSVTMIIRFPKCVPFYVFDILIFILIVLIVSPMFIIDMIFMIKQLIGISCIESFLMFLNILEEIDKSIYSMFSIHIIHYPESVINLCYKCDAMGDTSSYKAAASRLFGDVFISIPKDIGGPIGKVITGIGHIFSFLKLK